VLTPHAPQLPLADLDDLPLMSTDDDLRSLMDTLSNSGEDGGAIMLNEHNGPFISILMAPPYSAAAAAAAVAAAATAACCKWTWKDRRLLLESQ